MMNKKGEIISQETIPWIIAIAIAAVAIIGISFVVMRFYG